ncbi:hypothetical protein DVH05_028660 [Phytophthora capsici]|nr:hypothetical protein DVH05_028660 [Phytophthora capsici]
MIVAFNTLPYGQQMQERLRIPVGADIPEFIVKGYDASSVLGDLSGILVYPPAFSKTLDGESQVAICVSCEQELRANGNSPPAMAIANGNYIGWLPPHLSTLSRTDEQCIALVSPCVALSTLTGGHCKVVKSHHYIVKNTEGPVLDMLPRDLTNKVRVTMVGAMTSDQQAACRKRYELNIGLCKQALRFLLLNNRLYKRERNRIDPDLATLAEVAKTSVVIDRTTGSESPLQGDALEQALRDDSTYSTFGSTIGEGDSVALEQTAVSSSKILLQQKDASADVLVRKSNAYVQSRNWEAVAEMFPSLLPGGCGGPNEKRRRRISLRKWVFRSLSLAGHRFERHYAFLLLAFDFLALRNARRSLFVKMKVSTTALIAGNLSRETILESVKYSNHLAHANSHGLQPDPIPESVKRVIDLRKGLSTSESAYFGSNVSRMRARHDLFGYLQRFGILQLFFTISPDSSGTYSIAVKSGDVSKAAIESANLALLPTRAERKQIAGGNPMQCARYFESVVDIVIDDILGWDVARSRPKRGGGAFGVVRAFGAAAETQQAGDLHAHFAVWLYGFPRTWADLNDALTDTVFKTRLAKFADAVMTTNFPALDEPNICTSASCGNQLHPIEVGVRAFRRPLPGQKAPATSACTLCRRQYCDKDILNNAIDKLSRRANEPMTRGYEDYLKCRAMSNITSDDVKTILADSISIRDVQVHFWTHAKSCFKITSRTPKGSVCRFFKPHEPSLTPTHVGENGCLKLSRPIGCEYMNPYNPVIMRAFKCNHDVQLVMGSDKRNVAAYVCKYCMKNQNAVENRIALSIAAFTKGVRSANHLPSDSSTETRGHRILGSMLYSITNAQEVAAPLAALYIRRESPFWFSHKIIHIDAARLLNTAEHTQDVTIHPDSVLRGKAPDVRSSSSALINYWNRHASLEKTWFARICEMFKLSRRAHDSSSSNAGASASECMFVKSDKPQVVVISGRSLPDISTSCDAETRDFYFCALLLLFRPHRRKEFIAMGLNAEEVFKTFMRTGHASAVEACREFERQWADFYRSQNSRDASELSPEDQLLQSRQDDDEVDVFRKYPPSDSESSDSEQDFEVGDVPPDSIVDPVAANSLDTAREIVMTAVNLPKVIDSMSKSYPLMRCELDVPAANAAASFIEQINQPRRKTVSSFPTGTTNFLQAFSEKSTRLAKFEECFAPVPWIDPATRTASDLQDFPTIQLVSLAFKLNFWQHVVFETAARHLLFAYLRDVEDILAQPLRPLQNPYEIRQQFIGYLGGEAGTGKSAVIHSLLTFADKWGRTGSVETIAFTGVAAMNIRGKTMHSARNLKISGNGQRSASNQALLGSTDLASRDMTTNPYQFMGGKHTLLCGDWFQLPAVRGSPCYLPPIETASRYNHAGFDLYNAVNFVVFLTENMRAAQDAVYANILAELRWGRVSSGALARLNSRVVVLPSTSEATSTFFRPLVVATNKIRCAINKLMTFSVCTEMSVPLYEIQAEPNEKSRHIFQHIINANDDLTERIPLRLYSFIGMPIMVTRKPPQLADLKATANGTLGTIIGYYPPPNEAESVQVESDDTVVMRLLKAPQLIFVRLHDCDRVLVPGFGAGVIGIPKISASIKPTIDSLGRASITIEQFPIVPAFACTTEKLQGKTCSDGVVVTPLHRKGGVPPQSLYVALSRAKTLEALTLTQPLTPDYIAKFKPSEADVEEMQRLISMIREPPYITSTQRTLFERWKSQQYPTP